MCYLSNPNSSTQTCTNDEPDQVKEERDDKNVNAFVAEEDNEQLDVEIVADQPNQRQHQNRQIKKIARLIEVCLAETDEPRSFTETISCLDQQYLKTSIREELTSRLDLCDLAAESKIGGYQVDFQD